jgi:hypothetical protein
MFDLMAVTATRNVTFYMEINNKLSYKFWMECCLHAHNWKCKG